MVSLRLAVLSDLHASEYESNSTHVVAEPPLASALMHPLSDLRNFVTAQQLKADYVLTPGDIADRADATGLQYGWRQLNELSRLMDARLLGTPGNHDLVTHDASLDQRDALKRLLPSFPTGNIDRDEVFWQTGWTMVEKSDHRFLIIDTTHAFPTVPVGVNRKSKAWKDYLREIDRGYFTENVQGSISDYLKTAPPKLNIALLHHHPAEHQHQEFLKDTYGPMRRGSELIEMLSSDPLQPRWLVIHGHKHVPQLGQATTNSSSGPILFCAGSLGARLWSPIDTVAHNQVHVISVTDEAGHAPGQLLGTVDSFTWGYGDGWRRAFREGAGLSSTTGFGSWTDFRTAALAVIDYMRRTELVFESYDGVIAAVPEIPYLLPADFALLEDYLEHHGLEFRRDRYERIAQLVKVEAN